METKTDKYWTILIPYVPREVRTEWHPTQSDGPFKILSRGTFPNEVKAIEWAREHLNGTPYTLKIYV